MNDRPTAAELLDAVRHFLETDLLPGLADARQRFQTLIAANVLAAVPGARVLMTDGNAFFNRPGPRLVESLEIMGACVHPELFSDFASKHADAIVRLA